MKTYRYFLVLLLVISGGCHGFFVPSHHSQEEYTVLFAAAEAGDLEAVQQAIENDPTLLRATEWENSTLLHSAVRNDHLDLSRYLLQKGIEVNAVTTIGVTPLHNAARNSHIGIMTLLIEFGAKINTPDKKGRTPLDWAKIWGTQDAAELLRRHGGQEGMPK